MNKKISTFFNVWGRSNELKLGQKVLFLPDNVLSMSLELVSDKYRTFWPNSMNTFYNPTIWPLLTSLWPVRPSFLAQINLTKLPGEYPTQPSKPDMVEKMKKMHWRRNLKVKIEIFHILTFFSPFSIFEWPYLLNGWTNLVAQKSIRWPSKNSTFWSPIFPISIKKRLSYDFLNEID